MFNPRLLCILALVLSLGAACNSSKDKVDKQVSKPTAIAEVDCPVPPKGSAALMKKGSITLFGELHGTSEIPGFIGELACIASKSGRVIVGLETPSSMDGALQTYLVSDGSKAAKQELFKDRFWTFDDGRSSHAMLALIDELRELKASGRVIQLFGFDGMFLLGAEARDKGMAANIIKTLRESGNSDAVALLLSGNMHAQAAAERWMGWHLRNAFPQLRTLNNAYSSGSAWVCTEAGCGPMELQGPDRGQERFIELGESPDEHGYDGIFYVGAVSASPPATGDSEVKPIKPSIRGKANASYRNKSFADCARLYAESAEDSQSRAAVNDLYNAACCAALAGESDLAFQHLSAVVKGGYRDAGHLSKDTDLESLHADPRWSKVESAVKAKAAEYVKDINPELAKMYEEDQGDRLSTQGKIDWSVIGPRDEARRKRVAEILIAGGATSSADYLHAAMVFQHGSAPEDFLRAHELAVKAAELDSSNDTAKWLAAASEDRYLMHTNKPQRYGTQFRSVDGTWELYEVDTSVSDKERAKWNVPPLAEAHQRAVKMNESSDP